MCILGAVPFAVLGFLKYNGMTAEKFVMNWIKTEILYPKKITFKADNLYEQMIKNIENEKSKKVKKIKINKFKKGAKKSIENIKEDI